MNNRKITGKTVVLLFILVIGLSVAVTAEEFQRVKREDVDLSLLFGISWNVTNYSNAEVYYLTPYIYALWGVADNFQINFYLPFYTETTKMVDPLTYDNSLYYTLGLSDFSAGGRYTWYTKTINDLSFSITLPVGYFGKPYWTNVTSDSTSDGYFDLYLNYTKTWIYDPILFNIACSATYGFFPEKLYDEGDDYIHHLYLAVSFGYTEVLNSKLSYFCSFKTILYLPELIGFSSFSGYEIYRVKTQVRGGLSLRITENNSFVFSIILPLNDSVFYPYFDLYVSFRI